MSLLRFDQSTGQVTLSNGWLERTIETQPWYNPGRLRDVPSGRIFADSDYVWSDGEPAALVEAPVLTTLPDGIGTAAFRLRKGGLWGEQTFTLPGDEMNVLMHLINLVNTCPDAVVTALLTSAVGDMGHDG